MSDRMSLGLQAELAALSHTSHDWPAAVAKIENTHYLTIRQLCQILKADRHWVNQYIVSHFRDDIVRLGTGFGEGGERSGGKTCKSNWAYLAWRQHHFTPKAECVFLPHDKVLEFLESNISSVTRQTAPVRFSMCVADDKHSEFFKNYKSLTVDFKKNCNSVDAEYRAFSDKTDMQIQTTVGNNIPELVSLLDEKKKKKGEETDAIINKIASAYNLRVTRLIEECFTEEAQKALHAALAGRTNRSQVKAVPATLPKNWYDNISTVADILDYGDTYEMVYRNLFDCGALRIELALPDSKEPEKKSKKVFYCREAELLPVPPAFDEYAEFDEIRNATAEFASKFYEI